jgi:hypothetical protein
VQQSISLQFFYFLPAFTICSRTWR